MFLLDQSKWELNAQCKGYAVTSGLFLGSLMHISYGSKRGLNGYNANYYLEISFHGLYMH